MRRPPMHQVILVGFVAVIALGCTADAPAPDASWDRDGPPLTPSDKDPSWSEEPVWRVPTAGLAEGVKTRRVSPEILEVLAAGEPAPVIVKLALPSGYRAEGSLSADAVKAQRAEIASAQLDLVGRIAEQAGDAHVERYRRYSTLPYVALSGDRATLEALVQMRTVHRLFFDRVRRTFLDTSVPQIGASQWHRASRSYLSANPPIEARESIAVIDTGVDASHPFMTGLRGSKVVAEACFVSRDPGCPGGSDSAIGPGSGAPCAADRCAHGTHVAGIAAGSNARFRGVAPTSNIIAVQVFYTETREEYVNPPACGEEGDGVTREVEVTGARDSDIVAALEHVYLLRNAFEIAAVNLSLGGKGRFTSASACADDGGCYVEAVRNLTDAGIAVVAAAGNGASPCDQDTGNRVYSDGISSPACLPGVISVGSTTSADAISDFSQAGTLLDLLAPGQGIRSSVPGGSYDRFSGTSMATPHVAGAVSVLKALDSWRSVPDLKARMRSTGVPITDSRAASPRVFPRLQLDAAIESQLGAPLAPSGLTIQAISGTAIRVGWTDNSNSEDLFRATADPTGSSSLNVPRSASVGSDVVAVPIQRLRPNMEYELSARACWSNDRCSPPSNPLLTRRTANTLPSIPTNFRAGQVGPDRIEVLWDSQSTLAVDEFRIRSDANPARQWRLRSRIPEAARSSLFVGLLHDSAYSFVIQACNADGCSPDSSLLHVATTATTSPPAAPVNLRVCTTPTGPPPPGAPMEQLCFIDALTLLWDDTANNEDGFDVEWSLLQSPTGPVSGTWHRTSVPADYESHLFGSLIPGLYRFRVRACNAVACSAYATIARHNVP